jgi:hypothetical protein
MRIKGSVKGLAYGRSGRGPSSDGRTSGLPKCGNLAPCWPVSIRPSRRVQRYVESRGPPGRAGATRSDYVPRSRQFGRASAPMVPRWSTLLCPALVPASLPEGQGGPGRRRRSSALRFIDQHRYGTFPQPILKYCCAFNTTSPGQSRGWAGASLRTASPTVPACRPAYAADATCHWATDDKRTGPGIGAVQYCSRTSLIHTPRV